MAVNTSREEKLWARDRWIQTTQALVKAGITPVFVWGSAAEEERVRTLADLVPGTVVAPHMTLPEIASVLKASVGLIGVDTGISHWRRRWRFRLWVLSSGRARNSFVWWGRARVRRWETRASCRPLRKY